MLSQKLIDELRTIMQEEYALRLNPVIAEEIGNGLMRYFDLIVKINNENDHENENFRGTDS